VTALAIRPELPSRAPWRLLCAAVRAARDVDRATGGAAPCAVAREFAYELAGADLATRVAGFRLLASIGHMANGRLVATADVRQARETLEAIDAMGKPERPRARARVVHRSHTPERSRLEVERARAVPITDVLARFGIRTRRAGRQLVGRCPLHKERTPSFSVDPKRGLWYCHGCNKGGDGIALVRHLRGVDFAGAVRELAPC
jgi:hypothetical protein